MGTYFVTLLIVAMFVGLVLRVLRIPMDINEYRWRPFLYISRAFQVVTIMATVLFLPWIVGVYVDKPNLHAFVFFFVTTVGYVVGCQPGKWLYDWLVRRQTKKHPQPVELHGGSIVHDH